MEQKSTTQRDYPTPEERPHNREFGQETTRMDNLADRIDSAAVADRIADRLEPFFDLIIRKLGGNGNHTVVRPPEWATSPRSSWSFSGIDTAPEHRAFDNSINRIEAAMLRRDARDEAQAVRLESILQSFLLRFESALNRTPSRAA